MTALTHQITSRTLVAAAILAAALAGLIIALALGISATSGHSSSGQGGRPASVNQPAPGPGFRQPGCLACYR
ncbi:MAG TPA: hypothetical protein VGS06_09435 [Streptosporangiaceae bacterium]|nr:hypothetical protein [Streptosporangiaceae bacterium]